MLQIKLLFLGCAATNWFVKNGSLFKHIFSSVCFVSLEGVSDRASKRLFTKEILLPSLSKFPEPSQKIVSATASRYFIFWCSHAMNDVLKKWGPQSTEYMKPLCYKYMLYVYTFFFSLKWVSHCWVVFINPC